MEVGNWHVLEDKATKKRDIYYYDSRDSAEEFEDEFGEKLEDKREVPQEEWTAEETANILSSMMEDRNMHSSLYWPEVIVSCMEEAGIEKEMQKKVMGAVLKEMCSCHL